MKNMTYSDSISCKPDTEHVSQNKTKQPYLFWFWFNCMSAFASAIALAFVAMLIFTDSRLQGHPNKLIAYALLADAYTFWQYGTRYITCGFGINRELDLLFAYSF
jgi:hypothetical protein